MKAIEFFIGRNALRGEKYWVQVFFVVSLIALQFEEFQLGGVSVFRLFILPASVIGLFVSVNIFSPRRTVNLQSLFLALLLWLLLSCAMFTTLSDMLNKLLLMPFCVFMVFCFCDKRIRSVRYDRIFVLGTLASFVALLIGQGYNGNGGEMGRFCGIHFDPNFLCVYCVMSIASLVVFLPKLEGRIQKLFYYGLIALNIFEIFISQSRGGIVALLVVVVLVLLKYIKNKTAKVAIFAIAGVVGFSIWSYAQTLTEWSGSYESTTDQFLSRFNSEELEDGSGRTDIWKNCMGYINDHGNFFKPVGQTNVFVYNGYFNTHNSYIDFLADAGYFALLLFMVPLLVRMALFLRNCFVSTDDESETFMFMLASSMMVAYFFLSSYEAKCFWLPLIMAWCLPTKRKINQNFLTR